MSSPAERSRLRVAAMIEAAELAKRDSGGRKEDFLRPGLIQRAVLLDLVHVTESAERTSPGFKRLNPRFPWERLARLRNHGLVHDYEEVDLEDLWRFVHDELPRIRRMLDRMNFEGSD